jgi:hypothetical protein
MTEHDGWVTTNLAMWDERLPIHVGSDFYDVEGFLAGPTRTSPRPPRTIAARPMTETTNR